jgi:hypothetical protein
MNFEVVNQFTQQRSTGAFALARVTKEMAVQRP